MKKIIINDTRFDFPKLTQILDVELLNENFLVENLKNKLQSQKFNPRETLFIYPGKSAWRIRNLGFSEEFSSVFVPAKRIWIPGENPIITVGELVGKMLFLGIKNVVVVDDVLSSGVTISTLFERNAWRFPEAQWHAYIPITRKIKLPNYTNIIFEVFVPTDEHGRKPPINSLSTLLEDETVLKNYLSRNFKIEIQKQIQYALI